MTKQVKNPGLYTGCSTCGSTPATGCHCSPLAKAIHERDMSMDLDANDIADRIGTAMGIWALFRFAMEQAGKRKACEEAVQSLWDWIDRT